MGQVHLLHDDGDQGSRGEKKKVEDEPDDEGEGEHEGREAAPNRSGKRAIAFCHIFELALLQSPSVHLLKEGEGGSCNCLVDKNLGEKDTTNIQKGKATTRILLYPNNGGKDKGKGKPAKFL
jgi:hypothetical protein